MWYCGHAHWPYCLSLVVQGTLAQLDTQNPVMYVDFPEGRMKFAGTLVYPKSKYMVLKTSGTGVLCEDIFETMVGWCWLIALILSTVFACLPHPDPPVQVVFSDACWIGTKEDNPEEKRLPLPPAMKETKVHKTYEYVSGQAAGEAGLQDARPACACVMCV